MVIIKEMKELLYPSTEICIRMKVKVSERKKERRKSCREKRTLGGKL